MRFTMKPLSRILSERNLRTGGAVQKFIDNEVIRLMEPYVPVDTGFLAHDAPKSGTIPGSGNIVQKAPYAKLQYYKNSGKFQSGQRGKLWFERMKADHKDSILRKAASVGGARTE